MKIETGLKVLFVALQDPEKWGKEQDVRNICPEVQVKGLRLVVTAKAVRGLVRLTYQGKKVSQGLGSCEHDELTKFLPEWVSRVEQCNLRLSQGLDPFAEDEKSKKEITFSHFANEVYLPGARVSKRSYRDDESRLRKHILPYLGEKRFDELNMALVIDVLHSAKATGLQPATVNRIGALLSVIFNSAIDHELIASNPMKRVKKLQENNQIEHFLSEGDIQGLWPILNDPHRYGIGNKTIAAIIKFLLLTGVRKREALDMKWSDVDLSKASWHLKYNKSGKARYVTLSEDAVEVLQSMPKISEFIFANPQTQKPYNDIRKTFDKIMQCAGITNMRIHDLRHSFASLAVNSGESLFVVQKLLGHASPQTTQRYASIYQKVNTLNETFEYFSGAKLFAVINGAVKKNIASVSSGYYRMDKACSYQNFSYFKYRIQELLPTCNVTLREDNSLKTDKSILSFLGATKKTNEQMYQDSIDTAMEVFLSVKPSSDDRKTEQEDRESRDVKVSNIDEEDTIYDDEPDQSLAESPTSQDLPDRETEDKVVLKNYGVSILREQQDDEFYVQRLVAKYVVPYPEATAELVSTIAILSTYISNLEDIYQILKRKESEKVIMIAKAYASNIVVQYFVNRFYRYGAERYFGSYKLYLVDAATLMTEAFTAVQQKTHIPMKTFIDQKLVSGIKLDMRTKKMVIDPSKAANFFVRFFAVKDRNAKKPDLRYLEFHGISFGNYQYLTTAKEQAKYKNVSPQFQIGQRVFDSMTGECLSDTSCPLVRSRLIIVEEEFFDDAA